MRLATLALLVVSISCSRAPRPAIDADLAACIPPDTAVLAGLDLDRLRTTPLQASLTQLPAVKDASYLLIAYTGRDALVAARGKFPAAPAGATLLSSSLAVSGPEDAVRAAVARQKTGTPGSPRIIAIASPVAADHPLWIAAEGGVTLPLSGNLGNLNRVLSFTDSLTTGARIDSQVQLDATAVGRSEDAARQLEESMRAMRTFAAVGARRDPDLAATLNAIQISRDGRTVRATLATTAENLQKLFAQLSPGSSGNAAR